jgi:dTDP-4-amino-4,6-dideoxygalactose transaminase
LSASGNELLTPYVPNGYKSAWAQYSLLARNEDHRLSLQNRLKEEGIPTVIYYPKPLHLQAAFNHLGYKKNDFPISEDISNRIFSLPMHPYLREEEHKRRLLRLY